MDIVIVGLTEATLGDAPRWASHPYSCQYCLYWEYPEECLDPATEVPAECFRRKVDWLRRCRASFGDCGAIAYVDGRPAAYAQYAPPVWLPGAARYPAGPVGDDAILLSCLFIPQSEYRGHGLGRRLLAHIVADLRARGSAALETFGRKGRADNPSGPAEFYLAHGFAIARDDAEFPLLRLEL